MARRYQVAEPASPNGQAALLVRPPSGIETRPWWALKRTTSSPTLQKLSKTVVVGSRSQVHGLFVNADHWRKTLKALADAGVTAYAVDLLGADPRARRPPPNRDRGVEAGHSVADGLSGIPPRPRRGDAAAGDVDISTWGRVAATPRPGTWIFRGDGADRPKTRGGPTQRRRVRLVEQAAPDVGRGESALGRKRPRDRARRVGRFRRRAASEWR